VRQGLPAEEGDAHEDRDQDEDRARWEAGLAVSEGGRATGAQSWTGDEDPFAQEGFQLGGRQAGDLLIAAAPVDPLRGRLNSLKNGMSSWRS